MGNKPGANGTRASDSVLLYLPIPRDRSASHTGFRRHGNCPGEAGKRRSDHDSRFATCRIKSDCACYLETALLGKHQFLFSGIVLATENHEIALDPDTGKVKPTLRISSPLEFSGQRFGYLIVDFLNAGLSGRAQDVRRAGGLHDPDDG